MVRTLCTLTLLFFATALWSQDQMPTDEKGRKHGLWKRYHDNGKLRFKGRFVHGVEVDTFYFYFNSGELQALNIFSDKEAGLVLSFQYGEGERLAATGHYLNQKKHLEWLYYDADGKLLSKEHWQKGLRHGIVEVYHANGQVAEWVNYEKGIKVGPWEQFYEDGMPKAKGNYVNDRLEGTVYFFSPDGHLRAKGLYVSGLMDGTWKFYKKDKSVEYEEVWNLGEKVSTTQVESEESPSPIQSVDELLQKYQR